MGRRPDIKTPERKKNTKSYLEDQATVASPVVSRPRGMDLPPGFLVDHRYSIIEKAGAGGWGEVYKAVQLSTKRIVALKILKTDVASDLRARDRFSLEAEAVSKLVHENTVTLFDFGESPDGLLYIAMEYLEGETLDRILAREGALAPELALEIGAQVAASLEEAHLKGIIHRDIKPQNIMVTGPMTRPRVKVLDFGVAKLMSGSQDLTMVGITFGTPEFMSPEQVQSKPLDPRSDLYSLGIVMRSMLTGVNLFPDLSPLAVALKHIQGELPPLPGDLPPGVRSLIIRLTAARPEARFPSARDVIEEIGGLLAATGAEGRSRVRPPVMVLLVFLVIIGLGILYTLAVNHWVTPRTPAAQNSPQVLPAQGGEPEVRSSLKGDVGGEVVPNPVPAPIEDSKTPDQVGPGEVVGDVIEDMVPASELRSDPGSALADVESPGDSRPALEVRAGAGPEVVPAREEVRPHPDAAAPRQEVVIHLSSVPGDAVVLADGQELCQTPCELVRARGTRLLVKVVHPDRKTRWKTLRFDRESRMVIELEPRSLSDEDELKTGDKPSKEDGLKSGGSSADQDGLK